MRLFRCFGIALTMPAPMSAIDAPAHAIPQQQCLNVRLDSPGQRSATSHIDVDASGVFFRPSDHNIFDIHARCMRLGAGIAVNDTARGDP